MQRFRCRLLLTLLLLLPLTIYGETPKLQQSLKAAQLYDLVTREGQYGALSAMPQVDVEYGAFGRIRKVEGSSGIHLSNAAQLKAGDKATELLERLRGLLMANGSESLLVKMLIRSPKGDGHFILTQQAIGGIPVLDARVNVFVSNSGEIQTINSLFTSQGIAGTSPELSAPLAKARLQEQAAGDESSLQVQTEGSLAFWTDDGQEATPRLLWLFDALYSKGNETQLMRFGIDATSGELRLAQQLSFALNRTVYTNGYSDALTTPLASARLWTEGNPNPNDGQANGMYLRVVDPIQTWAGLSYAYDVVGLVAHYKFPNQAWHIYGTDNKSYLFAGDTYAVNDDAIAHEYAHGMFGLRGDQPSGVAFWEDGSQATNSTATCQQS